jgi:hypothetical protein
MDFFVVGHGKLLIENSGNTHWMNSLSEMEKYGFRDARLLFLFSHNFDL